MRDHPGDDSPRPGDARGSVYGFKVPVLSDETKPAECTFKNSVMSEQRMPTLGSAFFFVVISIAAHLYPSLLSSGEVANAFSGPCSPRPLYIDLTTDAGRLWTYPPHSLSYIYIWFLAMAVWNHIMHCQNGNISGAQRRDAICSVLVDAKYTQTEEVYKALTRSLPPREVDDIALKPRLERISAIISVCLTHNIPLHKEDEWTTKKSRSDRRSQYATRADARADSKARRSTGRAQSKPRRPPQSHRTPPDGAHKPTNAPDRAPLKLHDPAWDVACVPADELVRGGQGDIWCNKKDAPVIANKLYGGGGKIALVTHEPIRRPEPNPSGEFFEPYKTLRIAFESDDGQLIKIFPRVVTQLGEPDCDALCTLMDLDAHESAPVETTSSLLLKLNEKIMTKAMWKKATSVGRDFDAFIDGWIRDRLVAAKIDIGAEQAGRARPVRLQVTHTIRCSKPQVCDDGTVRLLVFVRVKPAFTSALLNASITDGITVHWADREHDSRMFKVVPLHAECDLPTAQQKVRLHDDLTCGAITTRRGLALRCLPQHWSQLTAAVRGQGAADRLKCEFYVIGNVPVDIDEDTLKRMLTSWKNGFKCSICEAVRGPRPNRSAKAMDWLFRADAPPTAALPTMFSQYSITVGRAPKSTPPSPLTEVKPPAPDPRAHARAFQQPPQQQSVGPAPAVPPAPRGVRASANDRTSPAARVVTPQEQQILSFTGAPIESLDVAACKAVLDKMGVAPDVVWASDAAAAAPATRLAAARSQLQSAVTTAIETRTREEQERSKALREQQETAAAQQQKLLAEQHEATQKRKQEEEAVRAATDRERARQRAEQAAATAAAAPAAIDAQIDALRTEFTTKLDAALGGIDVKLKQQKEQQEQQNSSLQTTLLAALAKMKKEQDEAQQQFLRSLTQQMAGKAGKRADEAAAPPPEARRQRRDGESAPASAHNRATAVPALVEQLGIRSSAHDLDPAWMAAYVYATITCAIAILFCLPLAVLLAIANYHTDTR
eukprot:gene4354-7794_t